MDAKSGPVHTKQTLYCLSHPQSLHLSVLAHMFPPQMMLRSQKAGTGSSSLLYTNFLLVPLEGRKGAVKSHGDLGAGQQLLLLMDSSSCQLRAAGSLPQTR